MSSKRALLKKNSTLKMKESVATTKKSKKIEDSDSESSDEEVAVRTVSMKKKTRRTKKKPANAGLDGDYWKFDSSKPVTTYSKTVYHRFDDEEDDAEGSASSSDSVSESSPDTAVDDDRLLYASKNFVTCRSPSNSFYLCQLQQNVYDLNKNIRIRWCTVVGEQGDDTVINIQTKFQLSYSDTLDPESILLEIPEVIHHSATTFSLKKRDIVETKRLLKRSIKTVSEDSDDMMDLSTEPSAIKKSQANRKGTSHVYFSSSSDDSSDSSSGQTVPKRPQPRKRKAPSKPKASKKEPAKKRVRKAKASNTDVTTTTRTIQPVTLYPREPFFEDKTPVPFISSLVQGKLAIRAVLTQDEKLLKSLIQDVKRVCSVHVARGLENDLTALHYAVKNNELSMVKILLDDIKNPKKDRCPFPTVSMTTQSTGRANFRMLGFRTARLMASRGAKEGNNALNQESMSPSHLAQGHVILNYAVENNCSQEMLDFLLERFPEARDNINGHISRLIRRGHRRLAAQFVGEIKDNGFYGFNYLHHQVLLYDNEDITINRNISIMKKTRDNDQITPIHCAAINPNPKYLKQLLNIMPEFSILDAEERRPIHYAAACEGPGPLEYLISKHVSFNDVDKRGNTALHIAAMNGRAANIELLLRKAKEKSQRPENNRDDGDNDEAEGEDEGMDEGEGGNEQMMDQKYGPASINRTNKSRLYPLHLAVMNNHLDCVKLLVENGGNVEAVTSQSGKMTPLMFACQKGHTAIVEYLVEQGASIKARDRFKRTPLIHACRSGNADIVAYLLNQGADPNEADSSLNSALHYAIAYGWYFCVRTLIEAGANINCVNSWQTTCLGTGFLKGHYGLCDYLLTTHHADINFRTEDGLTLVMLTVGLEISSSVVQQLEYVVQKHKADCTCVDSNGNNAFHYFAENQSAKKTWFSNDDDKKVFYENLQKIGELLLDHGCDPNQSNSKGQSPVIVALENSQSYLVNFFINHAKIQITTDVSFDGKTLLHHFAVNAAQHELIEQWMKLPVDDNMKSMGQIFDSSGRTPLHYCAEKFHEFCQSHKNCEASDDSKKEYQSIVRMIDYCLNSIECDPDADIKSSKVVNKAKELNNADENSEEEEEEDDDDDEDGDGNGDNDDDGDDGNESETASSVSSDSSSNKSPKLYLKSIFHLLRTVPFGDVAPTHPLKYLLEKTKDPNVLHPTTHRTPLLEAIHLQEDETSKLLINHPSCDVNLASSTASHEQQQTPLIFACKTHLFSIIRALIEHPKCDLLAQDTKKKHALHYYLATSTRNKEYLELLDALLQRIQAMYPSHESFQDEHESTPLHTALFHHSGAIDSHTHVEQRLIQFHDDLFVKDDQGNLPLHYIFIGKPSGHDPVELCSLILKSMKYKGLDTKNNDGDTPLHLAVAQCATVCVMMLQKHHASLLIQNNLGNSIIGTCIASNHMNLFIGFLQQAMDLDLSRLHRIPIDDSKKKSKESKTTEEKAPVRRKWHYAEEKAPQEYEESSLIHLIIGRDWQGALSLILDDLDRFHLTDFQIMASAIKHNKLNLVLRLFDRLNDSTILREKNSEHQNLFHLLANVTGADRALYREALLYLHQHRLDWSLPDIHGSYPLHYACVKHNFDFIEFLREHYPNKVDLKQTDGSKNTAIGLLFWSCVDQTTIPEKDIRSLIQSGKDLDCLCNYPNQVLVDTLSFDYIPADKQYRTYPSKNSHPRTSPLIHAIVHQNFALVKFLLELGADVNYSDAEKCPPIIHAVRKNNIDIVKLLLNKDYTLEKNVLKQTNKRKRSHAFYLGANGGEEEDDEEEEQEEENEEMEEGEPEATNGPATTDAPAEVPFKKTSSLNLNACDSAGLTCIHHLIRPFNHGTFRNNVDLLRLLHKCGASLTQSDFNRRTPIDYASESHSRHLLTELTKLTSRRSNLKKSFSVNVSVTDPNADVLQPVDFYQDAQAYIEKILKSQQTAKSVPEKYKVDPASGMAVTGELVLDPTTHKPFDVRLTKVDVKYGTCGFYNFYVMQIIKHKSKKNLFFLFTRWGRIGESEGQHQLTPFPNLDECQKEFNKVFRQKTGNQWKDLDHFQAKPKKYALATLRNRRETKHKRVPIDFGRLNDEKQHLPSKLHSSPYKMLMQLLLAREAVRTHLDRTHLDEHWLPVSDLTKETLDKARDLLKKIREAIENKDKLHQNTTTTSPADRKEQVKTFLETIYDCTNEYYTLLPWNGYTHDKLPIMENLETLDQQEKRLNDLCELELTYKILLAAQANLSDCSPLDYLYRSLNTDIEVMNLDDLESQLILRYIWTSSPQTQVEQIFRIARNGEEKRLNACKLDNHHLLWHGTNICNLISIFNRGLLIAPLTSIQNGSLFGKGIYTSDSFDKSLGYCSGVTQSGGERCFMLLCEVALGNVKESIFSWFSPDNLTLNPKTHNSRLVAGQVAPDPRYTISWGNDVQMPLGPLIPNPALKGNYANLRYNEYIVHSEAQVALRYLIQFRR